MLNDVESSLPQYKLTDNLTVGTYSTARALMIPRLTSILASQPVVPADVHALAATTNVGCLRRGRVMVSGYYKGMTPKSACRSPGDHDRDYLGGTTPYR